MYRKVLSALCVLGMSGSMAGCAVSGDWQTERAGTDFNNGTVVLGELILSATRQQVLAGEGLMSGAQQKFIAAGYGDEQIVDNALATVWTYCYGHNSGVPLCSHHGHFVAFVPMELRGELTFDGDEADDTGDLVEVELSRNTTAESWARCCPYTENRVTGRPAARQGWVTGPSTTP